MNNQLRTIALMTLLSGLVIGIGSLLGGGAIIGATLLALALNLGAYFYSDKLVLRMHGAKEVGAADAPRLYAAVADLARRAEVPMPKVYIIESAETNAFATGRDPKHGAVAFTRGILNLLPERELRGVIAHELGHIKHRDILVSTIAAIAASAISSIANILQFQGMFGGHRGNDGEGVSPLQQLAIILIAPLAATLLQLGISRSREYLADELGGKISGDPEALARALERLHHSIETSPTSELSQATSSLYIINPFAGIGGLSQLFSTHPPVEKRIALLLEQARFGQQGGQRRIMNGR